MLVLQLEKLTLPHDKMSNIAASIHSLGIPFNYLKLEINKLIIFKKTNPL